MTVAIVDYGSGNLRSAAKAFERQANEIGLRDRIEVTSDAAAVRVADRIVLPGVGAFGDCMAGLSGVPGMLEALNEAVMVRQRPFIGICVGMQLMARRGLEHGETKGLGWIDGEVRALEPANPSLKVPHMGWNELQLPERPHPILDGLATGAHVYFVHSYHMACADPEVRLATVGYGGEVTAVVGRDNLVGTQFHPEKSQANGLRLIANFLKWTP